MVIDSFLFAEKLWSLLYDCLWVLLSECVVDWIKHAFITRFNELPVDVYRDYSLSLAYDVAQTRQHNVSIQRLKGLDVLSEIKVDFIHLDEPW